LEYVTTDADVHGFCVHALRATAATNVLAYKADIAKVQEWLGHANIRLCVVMAKDVEVAYLFQPFRCRVTDLPGSHLGQVADAVIEADHPVSPFLALPRI
jgi:hypothetical protein